MRKSGRPTPESLVLRSLIQWLYHKKIFAWRNNSGSYRSDKGNYVKYGFPGSADILGILPNGLFLAVEAKSGKNGLTDAQEAFRDRIEGQGGVYVLARSVDDLERELALYITSRPF